MSSFEENKLTHPSYTSSPLETTPTRAEVILASARPKKRAGRRVFKETRHPVYRGVRQRNKNKWVCEMRVPNNNNNNNKNKNKNSRIWLGTYPTPEMAARAHDVAALVLRGKSACLNFADSSWRLTLPVSTDAVEIRRAAMEAAVFCAATAAEEEEEDNLRQESIITVVEQVVPVVSEFEELEDLFLGGADIADGPLLSPTRGFEFSDDWNDDVEIFEAAPVSLWDLSF